MIKEEIMTSRIWFYTPPKWWKETKFAKLRF